MSEKSSINSDNDAFSSSICVICSKDFSESVTELYYCLCDAAVCFGCIEQVKLDNENWECPKCNKKMNLEATRLFREHTIE